MTIEERRCPRCNIRRTVRLGTWGSVCLNCRRPFERVASAQPVALPAKRLFTAAEMARLESYRDAILAGLYADWPAQTNHDLVEPAR